jgi:hypothetical protein
MTSSKDRAPTANQPTAKPPGMQRAAGAEPVRVAMSSGPFKRASYALTDIGRKRK